MTEAIKVVVRQSQVGDWHKKLTKVQVDLAYLRSVIGQMGKPAIEAYLDDSLADLDSLQSKLPPRQKKLPF